MMQMKYFFGKYWKSSLWLLAVTIASLINKVPIKEPQLEIVGFDKVVHFFFYAILSGLIFIEGYKNKTLKEGFFWVIVFPIFFGGVIEIIQGLMVNPRSAEWGDFIADAVGSLMVLAGITIYKRAKK
jgi:VanZ family protein